MTIRTSDTEGRRRLRVGSIRRLFRQFGPHLRPHLRTLGATGLCIFGVTAMELLRPWPIKFIFDVILLPQGETSSFVEHLPSFARNADWLLALTALSILVIAVLAGLFGFGQAYFSASVGQKVIAAIRNRLYIHIQRLPHSFHDNARTGDLLARLTGDIRMMRELMVTAMLYLSERGLVLVGMLVVMLWMDWQLTLVALVVVPFLAITVVQFNRAIKGATRRQRRSESWMSTIIAEKISAISVVQAYAREAHEEENFAKRNQSSVTAGLHASRLEAQLSRLVQVVLAVGTALVLWFGVHRVQTGHLTPGDLLVFAAYLTGLYKPIRRLASLAGRVAKATVSGERVAAILDTEPEIDDAADAVAAPPFHGDIEFRNVAFGYREDVPVLRRGSFHIGAGETVALVGGSGSGKSTIASLLLRFYDPDQGSIRIDGTDIRGYTLASLRQQIAVILQESVLFSMTIRENIAYGKLDASRDEIIAAAKAANAHDFIERLPDGYDAVVGERGATLSGGQRQRIAIARAIIRDAPIVILDEPMVGLDAGSEASVREALKRLAAVKTTILITHDPKAAATADRVLVVRDGMVLDGAENDGAAESGCRPAFVRRGSIGYGRRPVWLAGADR